MDVYVKEIKKVEQAGDDIKDMGYICCLTQKFQNCIVNILKKSSSCNARDIKHYTATLEGIGSDVLSLACDTFKHGSNKCKKLIADLPKLHTQQKASHSKSFLLPLIEIMNNL